MDEYSAHTVRVTLYFKGQEQFGKEKVTAAAGQHVQINAKKCSV